MSVFVSYGALITPLGATVEENFNSISMGRSGVSLIKNAGFENETFPLGKISSLSETNRYQELLERVCRDLVRQRGSAFFQSKDTRIILSSTKADVAISPKDSFSSTWKILSEELQPAHTPLIISNACISGVLAINTAADYVQSGTYQNVVVIGIDVLSDFVVYGFQSLFALSDEPSKPFDKLRKGICIGEAAAAVIVSSEKPSKDAFYVHFLAGSASNDANHISGPSRTGEGLVRSVRKTLSRAQVAPTELDFISAHGTGTLYNDEMESIAFHRLGLSNIPLNSMKGYFGHTLGAAGVVETIISMRMMETASFVKSLGTEELGTSQPLNVVSENQSGEIQTILKTASGFGGGNASLILKTAL